MSTTRKGMHQKSTLFFLPHQQRDVNKMKEQMHNHSLSILKYQLTASFQAHIRITVMTCIDFHTAALPLCATPGSKMSGSQESAGLTFCIYNKPMLSLLATLAERLHFVLAQYNMNIKCCLQQILMK